MSNSTSTITAKWQITIPEEVRRELPFKIGQRIVWEVQGDKLVGRRVRSLSELAGSLKAEKVAPAKAKWPAGLGRAALERHKRLSRPKP